jgi:single-strand DNA-binding protein
MNNLTIVGRIGKVGELKYTAGGKAVVNFSVAVDNGKTSDGEKRQATWFEIAIWEKQAESLSQYLVVGDRIGVTGQVRLQVDEGRDGVKYPKLTIDFPRVELLGSKVEQNPNQNSAKTAQTNGRATQTQQARPAARQVAQVDEDIPF